MPDPSGPSRWFSAIRYRHRSIRYHAAARPDSAWTRWRERLILLAVPASIPVVLLLETGVHRSLVAAEVRGGLVGTFGGPYTVGLAPAKEEPVSWPAGAQQGSFTLQLEDRLHGWPLTSRVTRGVVALDIDFFRESGVRQDTSPAADSNVGVAIITRLGEEDAREIAGPDISRTVEAWEATGTLPTVLGGERYWPGTLAAAGASWLGLSIAAIIGTGIGRYATRLSREAGAARQHLRRSRGTCAACGFDLRGNLFAERCPECGALSE